MNKEKIEFRKVERKDLGEVFPLLQQLTEIDYSSRNEGVCWNLFIGESSGHIEDIVVDKNMRGKNVGIDLIKELIKIGKDKGCYRITLFCDKPLLNFYEKNGFKINGNEIALKTYLKK